VVIGDKKLPESLYHFKKVCTDKMDYCKNYFCKDCHRGFGQVQQQLNICPDCRKSTIDYFISTGVEDSLKKIVAKNFTEIVQYKQELDQLHENIITDINNAAWHRNLENRDEVITININTDGVAPFKSSKKSSLWPILVTLNDLRPSTRFQKRNVLSAGYWFSEIPPIMGLFLEPFIDEINNLSRNGIVVNNKRFFVIVCSVCLDSPARAKILCMKQYNGYNGCTFCRHPVINQRYPFMAVERRSYTGFLEDVTNWENMSVADRTTDTSTNGVKGRTELLKLLNFDPMTQVPVDFMHCILLGVVKTLLKLWFSSKYKDYTFYVDTRRKKIVDERFKNLKTYFECTRKSSTLTHHFTTWKANELFNFLFYYSKSCLCAPVLEPEYFQHFMLLQSAMEIVCSKSFTFADLQVCTEKLNLFVQMFETLYSPEFMVYNVHLLTHITETARLFGPLVTSSLFVFESTNGVLNKFLTGPKGPTIQICIRHFLYFTNYYSTETRICREAVQFCKMIMDKTSNKYRYTNANRISKDFMLPMNIANPYNLNRHFKAFKRYYFKNSTIATIDQSLKNKMYNDSYIYYRYNFYKIIEILVDAEAIDCFYIIGEQIIVRNYPTLSNYHEIVNYNQPKLIRIENAFIKCIYFKLNNTECLVQINNMLLVD
jgi:hypothetical protein